MGWRALSRRMSCERNSAIVIVMGLDFKADNAISDLQQSGDLMDEPLRILVCAPLKVEKPHLSLTELPRKHAMLTQHVLRTKLSRSDC